MTNQLLVNHEFVPPCKQHEAQLHYTNILFLRKKFAPQECANFKVLGKKKLGCELNIHVALVRNVCTK